jgi:hypothetical protein
MIMAKGKWWRLILGFIALRPISVLAVFIFSLGVADAKEFPIKLPSGKEIKINLFVSTDKNDSPYVSLSHNSDEVNLSQREAIRLTNAIIESIKPDIDELQEENNQELSLMLITIFAPISKTDIAVINRGVPISGTSTAYSFNYERSLGGQWQMTWPKELAPIVLCSPQEKIIFSCALSKKSVSLCASQDVSEAKGYLQYRIGADNDSLELELPNKNTHAQEFFHYGVESRSAKGSIKNVNLSVGEYTYSIYRFTHALEGTASGVSVKKSGKTISYLKCNENSVVDRLSDLSSLNLPIIKSDGFVDAPPR